MRRVFCCLAAIAARAEHEVRDSLARHVQLCSTKCCTASLMTLQCLLSMPWCRGICMGPEACTTFHEAVCHDAGRPPTRPLSQRVLADTFWVQLPCLLASPSFTQTHSCLQTAAVHACQQCMASQAKLLASIGLSICPQVQCTCCAPSARGCLYSVYSFNAGCPQFCAKGGRHVVSNNISQCTSVIQLPIVFACAAALIMPALQQLSVECSLQ